MVGKIRKTLSATDARKDFFKILEKVNEPDGTYVLTLGGRPRAVIMSIDEYAKWQETIEIMNDPEIMKDLKEAEEEFKRGEYVSLEEILAEEGLLVRDVPKQKYVVSRQGKKKSPKKSK